MAVEEFLAALKNKRSQNLAPRIIGSQLSNTQLGARSGGFKFSSPVAAPQGSEAFREALATRRTTGSPFETNYRNQEITKLATDIVEKSAGRVQTDEYGVVQKTPLDLVNTFNQHSQTINQRGKFALQAEESKNAWREASRMQGLGAYQTIPGSSTVFDSTNLPPGSSKNNPGGQAVAIAMTAYKNGTPYVWGGNSLTGGVDCSGLVQQVYQRLGIKLPRSTYDQAKAGKVVSMNSLQPGDLIFYNTGSRDPNGIGSLSHVAIYMGNGKVLEAAGRGKGIQMNSIGTSGTPARAVRPW